MNQKQLSNLKGVQLEHTGSDAETFASYAVDLDNRVRWACWMPRIIAAVIVIIGLLALGRAIVMTGG